MARRESQTMLRQRRDQLGVLDRRFGGSGPGRRVNKLRD
jgi:hypothetical protein